MDMVTTFTRVSLLYAWQLQADSSAFIMNYDAVFIIWASKKKISDPRGLPPLPRRSPSIYSKARSRIWFEKIVVNRNKFDDARYKYFIRMSRETVAHIVQAL